MEQFVNNVMKRMICTVMQHNVSQTEKNVKSVLKITITKMDYVMIVQDTMKIIVKEDIVQEQKIRNVIHVKMDII